MNLVTVEPWRDNTILIRLEHFLEKTDDPDGLSLPVTVNIQVRLKCRLLFLFSKCSSFIVVVSFLY